MSKRICMIGTQFVPVPAEKGGAIEYLSFEIAKGLAARGFDVTYYSTKGAEVAEKNLRVERFPAEKVNGLLFNTFVFLKALRKNFDIVYLTGCSLLPAALALKKLKRARLVFHEFNHNPWLSGKGFLYNYLSHKAVEKSDAVFVPSKKIREWMLEKTSAAAEKVSVVYDFVNLEEFPSDFPQKEKRFLFVGRIAEHKGLLLLLKALLPVFGRHPEWRLVVVGPEGGFGRRESNYAEVVRAFVKEKGLQEKVIFRGSLERAGLVREFRSASIFVLPSSEEAFGMVFAEAMASFTPVMGFDVGGVSEVVEDGKTGFLCKAGDIGCLSSAVEKLISDPALRREMGLQGRRRVERLFSVSAESAPQFEQLGGLLE